jgi:hypothetical protein
LTFDVVTDIIRESFGFEPEIRVRDEVLFMRVGGIDNVSLAQYILEKTDCFKITVKEREGYKFSDIEWIKIEYDEEPQIVFTGGRNICFH